MNLEITLPDRSCDVCKKTFKAPGGVLLFKNDKTQIQYCSRCHREAKKK